SPVKEPTSQPINDSWSKPLPADSTDEAEVRAVLGPPGCAIAAASELAREAERVSLNVARKRAGVDGRVSENFTLAQSNPFARWRSRELLCRGAFEIVEWDTAIRLPRLTGWMRRAKTLKCSPGIRVFD